MLHPTPGEKLNGSESLVTRNFKCESALAWAARGIRIIPAEIVNGDKKPLLKGWQHLATVDPEQIKKWWQQFPDAEIGAVLGGGLHVLDIDVKDGKQGPRSLAELGIALDSTLCVLTPSGGFQQYYMDPDDYSNGVEFAPGLDFRSRGGFGVAPGSWFGLYSLAFDRPIAPLPAALKAKLTPARSAQPPQQFSELDTPENIAAAEQWLRECEPSVQGQGGNDRLFRVAAELMRDRAISQDRAYLMLLEHYNPRCEPPWSDAEMRDFDKTFYSAAANAKGDIGSKTQAGMFGEVRLPATPPAAAAAPEPYWPGPKIEPQEAAPPFPPAPKPTLYLGGDPKLIPPRPWVYGRHYVRTFTGCTVAPGATGKSFLAIAEGLAIATGKPLLGIIPDERCNVWYLNLEDPTAELERRIAAAIIGHGINMDDLRGRFFADSGRKQKLVVASQVGSTAVIHEPVQHDLVRYIQQNRIGVMIVDPFLKSHSVSENDNNAVDKVMGMWADVAEDANCAIELIHHTRKLNGNEEPSADDSRGASAVITNVRSCRVVVRMTKDEANGANINAEARRQYFKLGDGKINMAPFREKAEWYHLDSVDLGNERDGRKSDSVGVVKAWVYPSLIDEVPANALQRVQGFTAAAEYRSDPRAKDWIGQAVADAAGWDIDGAGVKDSVRELIKTWLKDGYLKKVKRNDKEGHEKEWIVAGKSAPSLAEMPK